MTTTDDNRAPFVSMEDAAALEQMSYAALQKALRRRRVALHSDVEDRRKRLVPVSALSPRAYATWLKGESLTSNLPAIIAAPTSENKLQPLLPFQPMTETERELTVAIPPAIPRYQRPYVERWAGIMGDARNGTWRKHRGETICGIQVRSARDYIRVLSKLHGIGLSTIYAKLSIMRELERDPAVSRETMWSEFWTRALPQKRPGRSGHSFFANPENSWALAKLHSLYLNEAKLSMARAHELLCAEIEAKQRSWGVGHIYEKPTLKQCRTALAQVDLPTLTLAREGQKAYNDRCGPYISRRPPECANDVWVTDQRVCNVRLCDDGNRLGRVTVVNFLDVATWKWLGCWFGRDVNSDLVMEAVAQSLQHGVPGAVHMDLGKEFIGKRFMDEIEGLWRRLGVEPIKAIGRNPQSKIIERWHREVDRFDQEQPGWCGTNPDERPEKLQREEAAHEHWVKTGSGFSPLLTIHEYIHRYVAFCAETWNARHRGYGKYLRGMTPNEAWNTRQPGGGVRRLTQEEIDFYTADHRFITVARGGQINLGTTIEYVADQLFTLQGEKVEVIVPRQRFNSVVVIYRIPGGTAQCVAERKKLFNWQPENRDELRQEIRRRYAIRKALKRGLAAWSMVDENAAPSTAALAAEITATFGMPKALPEPKRATGEARRSTLGNLSSDIARELLETEAEG